MLLRTTPIALVLIASGALQSCANTSFDQSHRATTPASPTADDCPDVTRLHAAQLHGSWEVTLVQAGRRGLLTLREHPEFSASLRGELRLEGERAIASGDVEGGEFNLDESRDGKTLSAFWSGHLVPAACGAEIRGRWQPVPRHGQPAAPESDFILRRPPPR